jgi:hypothetical protein
MQSSPLLTPRPAQPKTLPPVDLLTGGSIAIVWAFAIDLARLGLHRARQWLRAAALPGRCARSGCPATR